MQQGFLLLTETLTFQEMLLLQAAPFHLREKKGIIRLGHRNVATVFMQLKQCCPQGAGKQGQREGRAAHPQLSHGRVAASRQALTVLC